MSILYYEFMRNAIIAGTLIAAICGSVSLFVVIRQLSFATHGLAHISLTGAAGAAILGIPVFPGQLIINIIAAIIIANIGDKFKDNDLTTGIVLNYFLGFGVYFLYLYQQNYTGSILYIIFGNILTVSLDQIYILIILTFSIIFVMLLFARPLFFSSIDPVLSKSMNIKEKFLSTVFFIILAITITMACQIVGSLLLFSLLIGPAAIASQWFDGFLKLIVSSIIISIISIWVSLFTSFYLDIPVSFCITIIIGSFYFISIVIQKFLINFNLKNIFIR